MTKQTKNILGAAAAAALVTFFIMRAKNKNVAPEKVVSDRTPVKKGDLSKNVESLQRLINRLFGTTVVEETGAYDKKTSEVVKLIFYNTKELSNVELGEVSAETINDMHQILDNINTKEND